MRKYTWVVGIVAAAFLWWGCRGCAAGPKLLAHLNVPLPVYHISFSGDGRTLIGVCVGRPDFGERDEIRVWEVATWSERTSLVLPSRPMNHSLTYTAVSPDGKFIAIGTFSAQPETDYFVRPHAGEVRVYQATTLEESAVLKRVDDQVDVLAFAADSKTLLICWGRRGEVDLVDVPNFKKRVVGNKISYSEAFAFSPDGKTLAAGGTFLENSSVRAQVILYSLDDSTKPRSFPVYGVRVKLLSFLPDGRRLVLVDSTGFIRIWEVTTGKEVSPPGLSDIQLRTSPAISVSPNGKWLVISAYSKREGWQSHLWNLETNKESAVWTTENLASATWAFSPDSKLLAGVGKRLDGKTGCQIRIWQLED